MTRYFLPIMMIITLSVLFVLSGNTFAQEPDTLDVPQGYETLNLAVQGDTTETGDPLNLNRVYRLERGGYYLLNGEIQGVKDAPLRIVAAKGDGPKPILIPAVDETGSASRAIRPGGAVEARGLYVTGIDNLGNQATKNMFRCDGDGVQIIIDDCFLDHDAQSFVRMNADEQKLYVTNSIMRNSILLANPNNGRFIDTRGNTQDTLFIQNSTFYMSGGSPIRSASGLIKNVILDHVTIYQSRGELEFERAINATVKNCLLIDYDYEGEQHPSDSLAAIADSLDTDYLPIDTLDTDLATEDQRNIMYVNNVYGYSPEVTAVFNSADTIVATPMHNVRTLRFLSTYPNMVSENNIEEFPAFSDAPDPSVIAAYARHRHETNFSNEGNPDPRADRNGMAALVDDPASVGPAADEYDFDYSSDAAAYTHAEGGFPVGDLNWFPDKKAEWEAWIATGVEAGDDIGVPTTFALKRNYPNPFNPSTNIDYQLKTLSTVKLTVYNSLGQQVRTLVNNKRQKAGEYHVQWNGMDETGQPVASGLYMYRLEAGNEIQTMKMLLMK